MAATKKFQEDPHWRDYIQFYEYFHGDNGAGLGASHQTGWTGVIARACTCSPRSARIKSSNSAKRAAGLKAEPDPASVRKPADKHKKIQRRERHDHQPVTE